MHESFLVYARLRWLKLSLLLCVLSIALYAWHDPVGGPSGGTWLGYGLGGLGAGLIVWLAWLGIRKRQYRQSLGSVKAWTSAHVYLGVSLLIIATLHSGFQFGWNLHTLSYALMVLVILSGIWGVAAYSHYPAVITSALDNRTVDSMLDELADLDQQVLTLADRIDERSHAEILRSVENTRLGGTFWEQIVGRGAKQQWGQIENYLRDKRKELEKLTSRAKHLETATLQPGADGATMMFVVGSAVSASKDKATGENIRKLLNLMGRRKNLIARINDDVTRRARMRGWLFLHVPLSVALLGALLAHVIAVFAYW